MASLMSLAPGGNASALLSLSAQTAAPAKMRAGTNASAQAAAQDFESVFLNTMFSQMTTGAEGDGPFGGGAAVGVWRSMLTQEYAKSFAKNGGIGIADHVYRSLIAQQEASSR